MSGVRETGRPRVAGVAGEWERLKKGKGVRSQKWLERQPGVKV